jgi:nucleoside-diphosphate-sugar epimerase
VGWSNRRVLVTGGGGFIGSHLVERLVAAGRRLARSYYVRRNAGLARSVFREG